MDNTTDIFGRAARSGPAAGAYFTILFLCVAYASVHPLLALAGLGMFLAVPFLLYRRLATGGASLLRRRTIVLWTEGIYTFLAGGLLMALLVYVWLRFIDPTYLSDQLQLAADVLRNNPDAATPQMRSVIENAIDHGELPGPIQMAMSLFWTVTFTGAVLSLLVAFIVANKSSK